MDAIVEESPAQLRFQILDTKGRPIGDELSAAVLTLYNDADGTILNGRNLQNVLNVNGGEYDGTLTITGVACANPVRITSADHPLLTGDRVHISGITGTTELNGKIFTVLRLSDSEFALEGIDGRDYTTYVSGGTGKIGLLTIALSADDNVISGTVANGQLQRHVAKLEFTAGSVTGEDEFPFNIEQRPQP